MPFDSLPQETKADPLSLEALVAWLEKQPATEEYCWVSGGHCVFGRYGKSIGLSYSDTIQGMAIRLGGESFLEPGDIGFGHPRTFGAALSRARTLLATQ